MVRSILAAVLLVAIGSVVLACSDDTGSSPGSTTDSPDTPSAGALDSVGSPTEVPGLIRARFGESPSMRRVSLSRSGFSLELRDPAKPENLDTWSYGAAGTWTSRPVSVSQSDIDQLGEVTFPLGSVAWDKISTLVQQALDGLDLEGEAVDNVSIDRLAGDPPRIYIGVSGLRGSGRLIARGDGADVEVKRN